MNVCKFVIVICFDDDDENEIFNKYRGENYKHRSPYKDKIEIKSVNYPQSKCLCVKPTTTTKHRPTRTFKNQLEIQFKKALHTTILLLLLFGLLLLLLLKKITISTTTTKFLKKP